MKAQKTLGFPARNVPQSGRFGSTVHRKMDLEPLQLWLELGEVVTFTPLKSANYAPNYAVTIDLDAP
jgi:hypothetical protein